MPSNENTFYTFDFFLRKFYALPKVHRINIFVKPIITKTSIIIYPFGKFLDSSYFTSCTNKTVKHFQTLLYLWEQN